MLHFASAVFFSDRSTLASASFTSRDVLAASASDFEFSAFFSACSFSAATAFRLLHSLFSLADTFSRFFARSALTSASILSRDAFAFASVVSFALTFVSASAFCCFRICQGCFFHFCVCICVCFGCFLHFLMPVLPVSDVLLRFRMLLLYLPFKALTSFNATS